MATAPATSELPSAASAKIPMLPLLLAVLLTGVLSVAGAGGALFYLVKSGRIPLGTAAAAPVKAPEAPVEVPSHVVSLDPMVVNLDDASGSAYLRLGMAVRVEDPAKKSKEEEKPKPGGARHAAHCCGAAQLHRPAGGRR
jgi:flagellar FliL protein